MKAIFLVIMTMCAGLQALTQSLGRAPDKFSHLTVGDPTIHHEALLDLQEERNLSPFFFTNAILESTELSPSFITFAKARSATTRPAFCHRPFWAEALTCKNEEALLQLLKHWPLIPWETHQQQPFLSWIAQIGLSERCMTAITLHIREQRKKNTGLANPFMTLDTVKQRLPLALVRADTSDKIKGIFLRETNCPTHHNHCHYQMNARVLYARTLAAGMKCDSYNSYFPRNSSSKEICLMFEVFIDHGFKNFEPYLLTLTPWTNRETVLRCTTILAYAAQALSKRKEPRELESIAKTAATILHAIFSTTAKHLSKDFLLSTLHEQITALTDAPSDPITPIQKEALLQALMIVSRDMRLQQSTH